MIISKPKFSALSAIGVFLVLCYSLGLVNLGILLDGASKWYNYAIVVSLLPLATVILIKQVIGYKIVVLKNQSFRIRRPFIFKSYSFKTKDIQSWKETIVKTRNGNFKELSIYPQNNPVLKLTLQENSNYDIIKGYLQKKLPKKRIN